MRCASLRNRGPGDDRHTSSDTGDTLRHMLIVSGIVSVEASDHDKMVELIAPLVAATTAETGNLSYGFYADPAAPGVFRVYEEWETAEAMGEHMGTDHMATFLGGMGALAVTGTELYQHEVSGSSRLM